MSDNTISHRVQNPSQDVATQVIVNIKDADLFSIQLEKSTDITGKAQLLTFSRFVFNGSITGQLLFCKPLPEATNCQDILDVVYSYFSS
jgi:hypothetical protein